MNNLERIREFLKEKCGMLKINEKKAIMTFDLEDLKEFIEITDNLKKDEESGDTEAGLVYLFLRNNPYGSPVARPDSPQVNAFNTPEGIDILKRFIETGSVTNND